MLQPFGIFHQFRKGSSLLLAFLAQGVVLPLQIAYFGDHYNLIPFKITRINQLFYHLSHQGFGAPVGIIGAGIDQIDTFAQSLAQRFCMMGHAGTDPIAAKSCLAGSQGGRADFAAG